MKSKACATAFAVFVLLSFGALNCGGGSGLDGTWMYLYAQGGGQGFTFNSGTGRFVFDVLEPVTYNSFDSQVIEGSYVATGSAVTLTPDRASCPGPFAVETLSYSFQGPNLVVMSSSGLVTYEPDTSTGGNVALTLGCFSNGGGFTPRPLGPVGN